MRPMPVRRQLQLQPFELDAVVPADRPLAQFAQDRVQIRVRTQRHERCVVLLRRTGKLDAYVFESLDQVREITRQWIREYNEE